MGQFMKIAGRSLLILFSGNKESSKGLMGLWVMALPARLQAPVCTAIDEFGV